MSLSIVENSESVVFPTPDSFVVRIEATYDSLHEYIQVYPPKNFTFESTYKYSSSPTSLTITNPVVLTDKPFSFIDEGDVFDLESIDFIIELKKGSDGVDAKLITRITGVMENCINKIDLSKTYNIYSVNMNKFNSYLTPGNGIEFVFDRV